MNENTIIISYRLTANDYFRVLLWYQWKRIALTLGLVLFLILLFAFAYVKPAASEPYTRFPFYFTAVLSVVFVSLGSYITLSRQAKKLESISDEVELTAGPTRLEVTTSVSRSQMNWERLKKVVELDKYFVFFPQDNVYFVTPKACFDESGKLQGFRTILKAELGERASLKV